MACGSSPQPRLPVAAIADRVRDEPARLGGVRLVCVDGPAGSGKTTLGRLLAAELDAPLVHLEELYAGWTLTGAVARLAAGVLRPLAEGRDGAFHRYDWAAERFAAVPTPVPVDDALVVEGCGSAAAALDRWTTLRIWIEAPAELRLARGLARDGAGLAAHWQRWQRMEAGYFAADRTRARADLRLDGASTEPVPRGGYAILSPSADGAPIS